MLLCTASSKEPACVVVIGLHTLSVSQSIFEENAAMSADQARKVIETMKVCAQLPLVSNTCQPVCHLSPLTASQDRGFYHEDIFGVTLKTAEVTSRVRTAAKK